MFYKRQQTKKEPSDNKESLADLNTAVQDISLSMTRVAENVALLGIKGNADEQMKIIHQENEKVLNRIRTLYNLPPLK